MPAARELRFAFVFDDHEAAVHLFRDVLELETVEEFEEQGARGVILRVPAATLELFDVDYGHFVDEIEAGRRLSERVRIAVKVDDVESAGRAVIDAGHEPMAEPVVTPWNDRNQRFKMKDGLQLTLFQTM